jgi:hypothetical protein
MRATRERRALPENILHWMRKEDRTLYGTGGLLAAEAIKKANYRAEIEEHEIFLNWCKLSGLPRIYSRPDKRPTIETGWPDFSVFYGGVTLFFEFKVTTKLSKDQEITIGCLREVGFEVFEVNLNGVPGAAATEALEICREVFGL